MSHSAENDRTRANCQTMHPHPPHDWEWEQDWGPQGTFYYHCPGVVRVTIEPVEPVEPVIPPENTQEDA